jgi:hypothetical protein
MQSLWKRQSCLLAVVLAAGGSGAILGLQPALGASAASGPPVVSRSITAYDFMVGGLGDIVENGDGTAFTAVFANVAPTQVVGVLIFENPAYAISTDIQPGQSGQGGGAGTGHFEMEGVFAFDFANGMLVGPFDVSVDLAVADTTSLSGYNRNGVFTNLDPVTGETSIVRETVIGNQAVGDAAGSLSIFVDDGSGMPGLVVDSSGVFGQVTANRVHIVQQIH